MGLDEVVEELYAFDASDFVAARDARAREARNAGDRELAGRIKALKRPSAAAWVVNILVRQRGEDIERLLEFGESFRDAQAKLAGEELRRLGRQRHQVLGALGAEARSLAEERGQRVSEAVEREVEATLDTALTDADAAEAVRSGRLLRSLAHAGMGPVDLDGALAAPDVPVPQRATRAQAARPAKAAPPSPQEEKLAAARADLEEAEADVERADHGLSSARRAAAEARRRVEDAEQRVLALEEELDRARERVGRAGEAARDAEREVDEAERTLKAARRRSDRARSSVRRLE